MPVKVVCIFDVTDLRVGHSIVSPPPVEAEDPKVLFGQQFQAVFKVDLVDFTIDDEEMGRSPSAQAGGSAESLA
eukprot:11155706-Lingulodinium_polyedra.AAC.1